MSLRLRSRKQSSERLWSGRPPRRLAWLSREGWARYGRFFREEVERPVPDIAPTDFLLLCAIRECFPEKHETQWPGAIDEIECPGMVKNNTGAKALSTSVLESHLLRA
jgi:hypothetical protein